MDEVSGQRFLVDTGATMSILPPSSADKRRPPVARTLQAANGSAIPTFGTRPLTFTLKRRKFSWTFTVAGVTQAILGADFLLHHGLMVDVGNRRLVDVLTFTSVPLRTDARTHTMNHVSTVVPPSDRYQLVLAEFPALTEPTFSTPKTKHGIYHHITTKGPPVHTKARRLAPAKLKAARDEFAAMEAMGIVRRSDSPWSSGLTVVEKDNGKLRPCGDYRRVNEATVPDRYPLPHIQDFAQNLLARPCFQRST